MITFAHPGALWLLALCVIPPILHLLNRQPQTRIRFPLTRFLLPSHTAHQGRRTLRELLLMTLRMLLLAALALLFAAPQWQELPEVLLRAHTHTRRAIVIDTSASMNSPASQQRVQELLKSQDDDADCLLFTTAPVHGQRAQLSSDDALAFGYCAGEPKNALEQALSWLNDGEASSRELVIISDLQADEWGEALPSGGVELKVVVHKLPSVERNAGITGVTLSDSANGKTRIMVTMRNFGMQAPEERKAQLYIDDVLIGERNITLPANSEAREVFMLDELSANAVCGRVVLTPSDAMPCDDQRYFFAGRAALPMAVVAHNATTVAQLLTTALTAHAEGQNAPCSAIGVAMAELCAALQNAPQMLILTAVPEDSEILAAIKSYAEQGGKVLYMPATPSLSQWRLLNNAGILKSVPLSLQKRSVGIIQVTKDSALETLFGAQGDADLFECIFRQWLLVKSARNSAVLMSFEDNAPALLRESLDAGVVFAASFGLERDCSDLPLSSSFLPLIREILFSESTQKAADEFDCGATLPSAIAAGTDGLRPSVITVTPRPCVFSSPRIESILEFCQPEEVERQLTRQSANAVSPYAPAEPRDLRALLVGLIMLLALLTVRHKP